MRELLVIVLLLSSWAAAAKTDPSSWVEELKAKYAPDRRLAFFDLEVGQEAGQYIISGETNQPEAVVELKDSFKTHGLKFRSDIAVYTGEPALVNVSVCNIRSLPKHSAELSTQSLMGTLLKVYKSEGSWYYVQTPDGYLGWLDGGALVVVSEQTMQGWQDGPKVVVTSPYAFVHAEPATSEEGVSLYVSDLVEGNILRELDRDSNQLTVALPDGRTGFVRAEDVMALNSFLASDGVDNEKMISKAYEFMGRPYLWGGTSGKGMDCSGFTKTVYYMNGLELPRDASQQVRVGVEVPTDATLRNLQRGDFLFFGRKASQDKPERITHVAIYLGEGKMIHASERIKIESLKPGDPDFAPHRLKTLVRAKRMLSNIGENGVKRLADHPAYQ